MKRSRPLLLLGCIALATACGGEERTEPTLPPPAETRWEEARVPSDLALLEAAAHVVPAPDGEARVGAPFTARVLAVHVRPGDHVAIGTPLLDVSMPDVLDAAARWSTSTARRSLRSARRTELESLRTEGLVESARVFDQDTQLADLDAERAQALAVLHAASVRESEAATVLRAGRTTLRSPIAGIVRSVAASVGEVRDPSGAPLVEIVSDVAARVEARFVQPPPEGARFTFRGIDGTEVALGSIAASVLDPVDGTRVAWLDPEGDARLPAGLAGRVRVEVPADDALEVPTSALVVTGGGVEVELASDDAGPARVPVVVLTSSATRAIVRGLPAGARVAVTPLRSASGEGE
ncbi:MAG: efflux RND transporter periplasmic adaptor subunit [Sandaracinus sp.]